MRSMPGRFALTAVSILCVLVLVACNCAPTLRYVTVAPKTATIDAGTTQQFVATAFYSDGTQKDVTGLAGWTSSDITIATVSGGVATGVAPGTVTITGSFTTLKDTATLVVIRTLESILISPAAKTVPNGGTQPYTAIGTFLNSDGTTSTQDITSLVTWNSSDTETATIVANSGLATAANTGIGSTNITATLDGITSNTAILTLGPPAVVGLQVTPATATIAVSNTVALTAVELLSNSTTQPLTGAVVWTPACTPVGSATLVGNGSTNNGVQIATGQAIGTCTITATESALTGTSSVTVSAAAARFAYIANTNDQTIGQYSVDATSATPLAPLTPATVNSKTTTKVFLHPNGLYAYAIDDLSFLHVYDIAPSTGLLTVRNPDINFPVGNGGTNSEVIDPTGRFLYVTDDSGTGTVSGFTISQTDGTVTAIGAVTGYTTNINVPTHSMIDQSGKYLYIVNFVDGVANGFISGYTIGATGTLTPLSTPTDAVGVGPIFATIESSDPTHPHMYVPNSVDNTISGFTIAPATGLLTTTGTATVVPGTPFGVDNAVVDSTGKFLYVVDTGDGTNPGQVYGFNIGANGVVGATPITGTPQATGVSSGGIAIDPTGKLIAIDNSPGTGNGSISLYSIGTGATAGQLTSETPVAAGQAPFGIVFNVAP